MQRFRVFKKTGAEILSMCRQNYYSLYLVRHRKLLNGAKILMDTLDYSLIGKATWTSLPLTNCIKRNILVETSDNFQLLFHENKKFASMPVFLLEV